MNDQLRAELLAMREVDQAGARACFEATEADPRFRGKFLFQIPREDWVATFHEHEARNREHADRLRRIVDVHGWPGISLVGQEGEEAAWLLLQHAGALAQRELLPALRRAFEEGEAPAQHLAAVVDREALESEHLQVYGTHLSLDDAGEHVATVGVVDPDRLDERRAELTLTPWVEYVAQFRNPP